LIQNILKVTIMLVLAKQKFDEIAKNSPQQQLKVTQQ
jgi:hypothetical protein